MNDDVRLRPLPIDQLWSALGHRRPLRVAVVHDWLYVLGGAEKVLAAILRCLPPADMFALFDNLSPAQRATIGYSGSRTSFLQRMPGIRRNHRPYLPLMPLAIEQLDLSGYDLVVSSSSSVAKGVLTGPDQIHISYVHSPMRYAWDLQHQVLTRDRNGAGPEEPVRPLDAASCANVGRADRAWCRHLCRELAVCRTAHSQDLWPRRGGDPSARSGFPQSFSRWRSSLIS